MMRESLSKKDLKEELLIDIPQYRQRGDVTHLIAFVYDPNHDLGNPRGFEAELAKESRPGEFEVEVIIAPRAAP